jgi:hypothetical protein
LAVRHLRPEDLPELPLSLLLLDDEEALLSLPALLLLGEDTALDLVAVPFSLLLPDDPEYDLVTVVFRLSEELCRVFPGVLLPLPLFPDGLCDLTAVPLPLSAAGALLLAGLPEGFTVVSRLVPEVLPEEEFPSAETLPLPLLLRAVRPPATLLSELLSELLFEFLSGLLPLSGDLAVPEDVLLPDSGRYTFTVLPLTLVVLPERLPLSSRRTVVLLPVSRS